MLILEKPRPVTASSVRTSQKNATFLCGVDVLAGEEAGGVVALGDSLTDGNISTIDAFCRWPDQLARRLAQRGGRPIGVMNNGLGGNRILHDLRGDSGLKRFDRDVLSQPGVTHAIVMLGTNDLRNRWAKPDEEVTGEQMIAGLQQMAVRAHSRGVKLIGATLTPLECIPRLGEIFQRVASFLDQRPPDMVRLARDGIRHPIEAALFLDAVVTINRE